MFNMAIKESLNKKIKSIALENNVIKIIFLDDSYLHLWDDGQFCCEVRYITTDDNLSDYNGSTLVNLEVVNAPNITGGEREHEVQFLRIVTDYGIAVFETHNEHNGYYGGFLIVARNK